MPKPLSVRSFLSPSVEKQLIGSLPASRTSEQFLRFHLLPDTTVLLPIQQLTEVLTIPRSQIVPIFQMPTWVMGAYNWRGEVLWIVDLGYLVGLTPGTNGQTILQLIPRSYSKHRPKTQQPLTRRTRY